MESADEDGFKGLTDIPSVAELTAAIRTAIGVNLEASRKREMLIYTWGDKEGKSKAGVSMLPGKPKLHLSAKVLNGRGGGACLHYNATKDRRIVRNVVSSMKESEGRKWIEEAVRKIEAGQETCISVFCNHGRHRSVSAALILQKHVYPNAQLKHLTWKKKR